MMQPMSTTARALSRRSFLSLAGAGAASAALTPLTPLAGAAQRGATAPAAGARRPNVLLIYSDDQGAIDLNCYGARDLVTPNLDGLAGRGVRFTQFYSAAPLCSASRAALLSGMYPQRAGVPGNVSPGAEGMPSSRVTIAEMLKSAGYATAHVGKWHLGHHAGTVPNAQGFDHSFGHLGGCIDNYSHFFYWDGPNRHDLQRNGREVFYEGRFFGDLMTEEIDRFVTAHRRDPWFCYWAINMPHYPYQGRAAWLERYRDLPYPRNLYAAFMSTLDELVGTVVARLRALGLDRDTIVIFQADQGHSMEVRAHSGGGSAGPYRGAKFSLFEGGIRVPAIVSWPGRLPNGAVRGQFCTACDWLPTIAEWTGSARPAATLAGHSLADIARGDDVGSHHAAFHWRSGGTAAKPQWAVREGDWKLIGNPDDTSKKAPLTEADALFLSNPPADPSEMTNLAAQHPDIVARLARLHEEWAAEMGR